MAEYHLFSTWDLEAPVQTVWEAIKDAENYPRWWKYEKSVELIEPAPPGQATGAVYRYHMASALPYSLSFNTRITRFEPPNLAEGTAEGELDGVGVWELKQMDGFTRLTYDWKVRTTKAWMNLLAPIARPVFTWNHFKVMSAGGQGLADYLGVKLLAMEHKTLA